MMTARVMFLGIALGFCASQAQADRVFNLDDGVHVARATLSVSGNQLQIILENMATQGTKNQGETLSGLWFDAGSSVSFSSGSVALSSGSYMINPTMASNDLDGDGLDSLGGVSGEWALEQSVAVSSFFPSYDTVISSSGLGDLLGVDSLLRDSNGNLYTDLDAPSSPNGINYGIVSSAGLASNANNTMNSEPLVAHGVVITLDFTGTLDVMLLDDIAFNYGTDVTGYVVPAPGAAFLGLLGLSTVGWVKRRWL